MSRALQLARRLVPALAFLAGVAVAAGLTIHSGAGAVAQAFAAVGLGRLLAVCGLQFVALALCAVAWWLVAGGLPLWSCLLARWVRDSATNLAGFFPALGEAVSSRALAALARADQGRAAASTIVDAAVEALAQAVYTLLGLALLLRGLKPGEAAPWLAIVAVGLVPVLLMYAMSRHAGALTAAERLFGRIAGLMGLKPMRFAEAVQAAFADRRRANLSFAVHLLAWAAGALQIFVAARALGHPLDLGASIALQSLVCAARSAFFLVPWAAGVQEGGFLLVGRALGLAPTEALALSFVLRARDILTGAPGLLLWYAIEARLGLRRGHRAPA